MRTMRLLGVTAIAACLSLLPAMPAAANGDYGIDHEDPGLCPPIQLNQARAAHSEEEQPPVSPPTGDDCADVPHFRASFLNRVWKFEGSVDWFQNTDDHLLSLTLDRIVDLPRRFRSQDDDLLNQDMYALLSERTRVYSPGHRRVSHDELENAEDVQVRGRLLAPRNWRESEDGDLVPTVRAKRIYVRSWVDEGSPSGGDEEPVR